MTITVTKTLPESNYYTGSGVTEIELVGVEEATFNTKKTLIKIIKRKTKSRQLATPSDEFDSSVVDLKNGTDEINVKGWLEDDGSETAWNKAFKLRAMCSVGGPVTSLVVDNITFNSDTKQVFLENVMFNAKADDTGALNVNKGDGIARISVQLNFYLGNER